MNIALKMNKLLRYLPFLAVAFFSGCVINNPQPVFPQPLFKQPSQQLFYASCVMGSKRAFDIHGKVITPEMATFIGSNCICLANNKQVLNLFNQIMYLKLNTFHNPNQYQNAATQAKLNHLNAQMTALVVPATKMCLTGIQQRN